MATLTQSQSQSNQTQNQTQNQNHELPDNLYTSAFSSLPPRKAHNTLIGRLRSAKTFNEELADYFKERLTIEDQYVKSLLKLSKKPSGIFNIGNQTNSTTNEDEEISGGISKIKQSLQSELIDLMDSHSKFQIKVHAQVESSFRNCSTLTHLNWSKIISLEDNLNITIKNCEDLEAKWHKSKAKLNGTSNIKKIQNLQLRLTEDQKNLNQAKQLYIDQAPMIYDSYQKFDQTRLVNLIETLTKFEAIQTDHSREKMEIFDRSMNTFMSFNCREEMERFAIRNGFITQTIADSRSRNADLHDSQSAPNSPGPRSPNPSSNALTPRHPLQTSADREHTSALAEFLSASPSRTIHGTQNPTATSESTSTYDPNHATIPQLSAPNVSVPVRSDTVDADTSTSSLPSRDLYVQRQPSIKSMTYMQRVGSASNLTRLHTSPSSRSISSHAKPGSSHSLADKIFSKSRFTNMLARNSGDEAAMSQARQTFATRLGEGYRSKMSDHSHHAPGSPVPGRPPHHRNSSLAHSTSGATQSHLYNMVEVETRVEEEATEEGGPSSSRNRRLSSSNLTPSAILHKRKTSRSAPSLPPPLQPDDIPPVPIFPNNLDQTRVDAEGFTIPPEDRDRKPWETNGEPSELLGDEEDTDTNGADHAVYKNVRNSRSTGALGALAQVAIKPTSPSPINESDSERIAAFQKVQNTLASGTSNNSLGAPPSRAISKRRSASGLRGRRADGRGMTMYDAPQFTQSVARFERAVSNNSRADSTENVPLSVVRDAKISKQQQEAIVTSSQEINSNPNSKRVGTNPFTSSIPISPVEQDHVSPQSDAGDESSRIQPSVTSSQQVTGSQPPSALSQLYFDTTNGKETSERHVDKSRANSVVSSMSYTTGGFHFSNHQGASFSGNNPFLNRSFSPSINFPGSASHTSGFPFGANNQHHQLNSSTAPHKTYAHHGLTAIIKETLNVLMDKGEVTKVLILGELKFVWPSLIEENLEGNEVIYFKIHHHGRLEKIVCPLSKVVKFGNQIGEYILDINEFKSIQESTYKSNQISHVGNGNSNANQLEHTVLKYRIYFDTKLSNRSFDQIKNYLPVYVIPRWRAKKSKTELMLTYEPNSNFHQFSLNSQEIEEWEIEEFEISTTLYNPNNLQNHPKHSVRKEIESHQELPGGVWDGKENEIKWGVKKFRYDQGLQKIVGRFFHPSDETNEDEEEPLEPIEFVRSNCGPVNVKMKMKGVCVSGIKLEVLNDRLEEEVEDQRSSVSRIDRFEEVVMSVVSGTFLAR